MNSVIIGFAGGGGVECGLIEAGITPTLSIEFDPQKPKLSEKIANVHQNNFSHQLIRTTVQEWANKNFPYSDNCFYAHFSPPCCNFSVETNKGEQNDDVSAAMAIADFIAVVQPKIFTFENVPQYAKSYLWTNVIRNALYKYGYFPHSEIINFANYGVPQSRKRLFCVAIKGSFAPHLLGALSQGNNVISWYESIKDLIPSLEETKLSQNQFRIVEAMIDLLPDLTTESPLLIPRVGYRNLLPPLIPYWKPAPTIKRAIFDDRGKRRHQVWTIWDGQKAYNCNIEVFRELQTFPDWYQFSGDNRIDGSIIGNSVPPLFIEKIMKMVKCQF